VPPDAVCPLCWEDQPVATAFGLAPELAQEAGLAPALAPRYVELAPAPGWRAVLEGLPPDSLVRLAPGTYRFEGALRLPPGLTLEGAGHERTTVEGKGAEGDWSLLIYPGPGLLTLRGLTLRQRTWWWQRLVDAADHPHVLGVLGGAFLLEDCAFPTLEDAQPLWNTIMRGGTGVAAPAKVPGTVRRCHFVDRLRGASVGIYAGGPLWVEQCSFRRLAKGVDVFSGRLVVGNCQFEENAVGVDFRMQDDALESARAGCVVRNCHFRDHERAWLIEPPWRARWYDNTYEGRR
jgi:hypothetical protein